MVGPVPTTGLFKGKFNSNYMNEKIKQHLTCFAEKKGWKTDNDTLIEIITEANPIYENIICERRWWNDVFRVVNIEGMLIGYEWAKANRDESIQDLGFDFDSSTICEVKPTQKIITVYEKHLNPLADSPALNNMNNFDPGTKAEEVKEAPAENAQESAAQDQAMGANESEDGAEAGEAEG